MRSEFWADRWRTGKIGFHQATVDKSLERHWPELQLSPDARVFVPLCGKSVDLAWLHARGHVVIGVELSDIALGAFCLENGVPARRRAFRDFDRYEAPGYELLRGDLFALSADLLASPAAFYDRAALISWTPELRTAYAQALATLLPQAARGLLITLEYPQSQFAGPPFAVPRDLVESLLGTHFSIEELARVDVLPQEPRLRARGVTQLTEVCYVLTRV